MDTTLSDPLVDRLLDGRYAVTARLARGGMASVYLATDTRLERRVAIKVMHPGLADDPDFVARFNREARAAARLSHPDVVAVFDQGNDDGHAFLVMEYVAGVTLRALLRERGRLTPAEAVAVMDHVLAALGAAHAAGLVHRDIKPENVLITADGRVKVADFGLARAVAGTSVTAADGALLGTAAYVAPEAVRDGSADARSDVYSAGVLLFELLTGSPPFRADTPVALAYRHVNEDVPPPSSRVDGVPPELDGLVLAATAREPEQRPADARALQASLLSIRDRLGLHAAVPVPPVPAPDLAALEGAATLRRGSDTLVVERTQVVPPVPPASDEPAPARRRRRRWPIALAILVVLALLAAVGGWYLAVGRYTSTPRVLGLTKAAAVAKLDHAGLKARWLPDAYSNTVDKGLVLRETPAPGHDIRKNGTVTLQLSAGPEMRKVPDVRNDTVNAAKAELRAAHLGYAGSSYDYSASVPSGRVISTDPPAGSTQRAGTDITLIVSKGQAPVKVPSVVGKPANEATSLLQALGLQVTQTQAFSDTVKSGNVISTDPASGTTVRKGDTVQLVVSKGPQLYPVPDVTGMRINKAIQAIEQAGFKANPQQIFPGGPGKVVRETPTGQQPKGTTIELDYF